MPQTGQGVVGGAMSRSVMVVVSCVLIVAKHAAALQYFTLLGGGLKVRAR